MSRPIADLEKSREALERNDPTCEREWSARARWLAALEALTEARK
jgi:hypothetical protein